jgi:hypothetical protein
VTIQPRQEVFQVPARAPSKVRRGGELNNHDTMPHHQGGQTSIRIQVQNRTGTEQSTRRRRSTGRPASEELEPLDIEFQMVKQLGSTQRTKIDPGISTHGLRSIPSKRPCKMWPITVATCSNRTLNDNTLTLSSIKENTLNYASQILCVMHYVEALCGYLNWLP